VSASFEVAVLVGSLRKASISRRVAEALIELQPASLRCSIVEIGDLPIYNQDLDPDPPASWSRLRSQIQGSDAVLFVTPEYNRSIPGGLKNAMDVASRPEGKNVLAGRAAGVVSVTPYKLGAFGANHALRQALVFLDMPVLQQPEAYIGGAADLFDESGSLKNKDTKALFEKFMGALAQWVATTSRGAAARSFEAFMQQRSRVAEAYAGGDSKPLDAIVTGMDPASFFSPKGDSEQGAKAVAARYRHDASSFSPGGSSRLEIHQQAACGNAAWWTGLQIAEVRMKGKDQSVPMTLRITEAFRFEDGGWKLVHRHADPMK
jgi:NAD(P)H-dependent FMN reductase/ketosteroid isomerase-like protein